MNNIGLSSLLDSAELHRKSDIEKSHEFLDIGFQKLLTTPNDSLECLFYYSKMLSHHYEGDFDSCHRYLEDLCKHPCYNSHPEFKFRYYYFASVLQRSKSNVDSTIILLNKAKEFIPKNDYHKQLQVYSSLGAAYHNLGEYKHSLELNLQAEDLFERVDSLNPILKANVLHNIGAVFYAIGANEKAKDYLNKTLIIAKATKVQKAQILLSLGGLFSEIDSLEKSKEYYYESLSENDFNPYLRAYAKLGLGEIAFKKEQYIESEKYLTKAYTTFQDYNDRRACKDVSYLMASIKLKQELVDESKLWIEKHQEYISGRDIASLQQKQQYLKLQLKLLTLSGKASVDELNQYSELTDSINDMMIKTEIIKLEEDKRLRESLDSIYMLNVAMQDVRKDSNRRGWFNGLLILMLAMGTLLFLSKMKEFNSFKNSTEIKNDKIVPSTAVIQDLLQQKIMIDGDKKVMTHIGDINSIAAKDGGIQVKLINGTTTFLWSSLVKYINKLPGEYFMRISKFHIINLTEIKSIVDLNIQFNNGDVIKYSPAYKEEFLRRYNILNA